MLFKIINVQCTCKFAFLNVVILVIINVDGYTFLGLISETKDHNKIYDILATTCTKKWWEESSHKFTAENILSYGESIHEVMKVQLPQYDRKTMVFPK